MPIYSNVTGNLLMLTDLPLHLEKHMCSPVRWKELVANGMAAGLCSGVEIGPGKTLAGFAKKISKDFAIRTVETTEELYAAAQNI